MWPSLSGTHLREMELAMKKKVISISESESQLSSAKTYLHSIVCMCPGCYANSTGEFLYRKVKGNYGRFLARIERMKKQDKHVCACAASD